jgi:hypothetical protein
MYQRKHFYIKFIKWRYENSATTLKKFMKGYIVYKVVQDLRKQIVKVLDEHMNKYMKKYKVDLSVKLIYQYRQFRKRNEERKNRKKTLKKLPTYLQSTKSFMVASEQA